MMIERGPDRRWRKRAPGLLLADRRDGFDRRALVVPAIAGTVRPGFGEAAPRIERRRQPACGMD